MPVRSLIEFEIREGAEQAFETAYLQHGFLDRARGRPGFLSGEFLRKKGSPVTFWATALWQTQADYEAWQTAYFDVFSSEEIQALGQHLIAAPQGFVTEIASTVISEHTE